MTMGFQRVAAGGLALAIALLVPTTLGAGPFKVGAYYFGVYNQASCNNCGGGNTDWWKGVRDYYNGDVDPPWQGQDFSYLKPALGFYDNSQTTTVAKHIRQARANGLQYFNFYWYWRSTAAGGQGAEAFGTGLQTFLAAPNTEDLEFAVSLCAHPWDGLSIPSTHFARVADFLAQSYLGKPHYLRTTDGRPVVFLLDTRAIGDGTQAGTSGPVAAFITQLRQTCYQRTGKYPFVIINTELHNLGPVGTVLNVKTLSGVEGYSCLNYFGASLDGTSPVIGTMNRYNLRITGFFGDFTNRPYVGCYMTDFDEKPRTRLGIPWPEIRYVSDWSSAVMRSGLNTVRQYSGNRNDGVVDNYVTLYAWNEWHEGGMNLEPSDRDGNAQLAQVAQAFSLTTSGSSTCKKLGNCTHNAAPPTGTFDQATCTQLAGWARDADTSVPLRVHVYKNGPYGQGGVFVGSYLAKELRTDLPFRDQKHGFAIPTPSTLKLGVAVPVYVYAINVNWNGDPDGTNPLLASSPRTITCNPVGRDEDTSADSEEPGGG